MNFVFVLLLALTGQAAQVPDRVEAGRILFDRGVDGLNEMLQVSGAPPLTFDQESQVRTLHEVFQRQGRSLLEEQTNTEAATRAIAEQLFLAVVKFLNPVQR